MYDTVLAWIRCLTCRQELRVSSVEERDPSGELVEGMVACPAGHSWSIEDGILVFTRDDAPSDPWSRSYAKFSEYEREQGAQLAYSASKVTPLLESLHIGRTDVVLDICTGAGGLLFNLLNRLDREVQVISLDMSLTVQRHNRRYMLERYGAREVSFVSADAADMPFRDGAVSHVVSYGMGNMLDKMACGVAEAARVLMQGGTFSFTHNYVDEESEGWRVMSARLREAGVNEDIRSLGVEPHFITLMNRTGLRDYAIRVTDEVVGDPARDAEADSVFPYPNERLTELLVTAVT